MLFATIEAAALHEAAGWVSRICPTRHSEPVMLGIVLESTDDALRLSAYDFETAGTADVPAVVRQPGRALVAGRLLAAIAKVLDPKKDVSLADDGSTLRMTQGRNVWSLPCLPLADYPILPTPGASLGKIDTAALRRALHRLLPTADRHPAGVLRAAIHLVSAGNRLCFTSSDGYRMACAEIDWQPVKIDEEINILVPTIFAEAAFAALPPSSAAGEFGASSGVLYLASPSRALLGRLGAGEWPKMRHPPESPDDAVSAIFVVSDLVAAVARVAAVHGDDSKPIRLSMGADGFELESLTDAGAASAEAIVSDYNGEPKTCAVSVRYLNTALSTLESDLAVVRTRPPAGAALDFVPLDADGVPVTDFRHIIMPVSIRKLQERS